MDARSLEMKNVESPSDLVDRLVEILPPLAEEFDDEPVETYHEAIQRIVHRLAALLGAAPERIRREFGDLLNAMVLTGGDQENAISSCLLEHASQVGIRKIITPYLSPAARNEVR